MSPGNVLSLTLALALAFAGGTVWQDQDQDQDKDMELPKATKHHAALRLDVGTWDAEMKYWAQGPDQPPAVSAGVETNRMLGDLWLIISFEGSFMGGPFIGHGMTGYDPDKGKYVGVWADNMTTELTVYDGTWDAATKTMTNMVPSKNPMNGEPMMSRHVTVHKDDATRVFTIEMPHPEADGGWMKVMEITYKKRGSMGR